MSIELRFNQMEIVKTGGTGNGEVKRPAGCQLTNWFISSASVILIVTGVSKLWSAFGHSSILAADDPVTGVQFWKLMVGAGLLELWIACICLFGKRRWVVLGAIAWLATNLTVYRIGLWWTGWHRPCRCLGDLTDALNISPQTADLVMKIALIYLLAGSYVMLSSIWWQNAKVVETRKILS